MSNEGPLAPLITMLREMILGNNTPPTGNINSPTGGGNSPLGAIMGGNWADVGPSLQRRGNYFAAHPDNIRLSGDMVQPVGAFTNALRPISPITPPVSATSQTVGQIQQSIQHPDLTAYENAFNKGDWNTVKQLGFKYPNDARFQIHVSIPGLMPK